MRLFHSDAVVAIDWHRRVWWGRLQPSALRMANDLRRQGFYPTTPAVENYRFPKQQKFARRFLAAQRGERPYPQQHLGNALRSPTSGWGRTS